MGLRTGAYIAQRTANALRYIHNNMGYDSVVYIDDYIGAQQWLMAYLASEGLSKLFGVSGFIENFDKKKYPGQYQLILGLWFNSIKMSMEIDVVRLEEIKRETTAWLSKKEAKRKEVESIVGLLNFVAKCVRPSRIFMTRLFDFLKEMPLKGSVELSDGFKQDISWWNKFMPHYNGVSLIPAPECASIGSIIFCISMYFYSMEMIQCYNHTN